MKKKLIVLFILLFIPVFVHAEDSFTRFYGAQVFYNVRTVSEETYLIYSTDVTYENGMYTLTGEIKSSKLRMLHYYLPDQDYYYTCESSSVSSCSDVTVVYKEYRDGQYRDKKLGIQLVNNQRPEDKQKFYIGKDFTYEDGVFTLVDYEEHNISEITSPGYFDRTYEGYFFCPENFGISCENMVKLYVYINTYYSGEMANGWIIVGDGYQYVDGQFKLINPQKIYPASTDIRSAYGCEENVDTCDEIYSIRIGESCYSHDGGREYNYTKVVLPNDRELDHVNLITGDKYKIDSFFTEEEINEVIITDPSIVEIDKGAIIAKKAGETSLIYETNGVYKELVITITEQQIKPIENPKTSYKLYLVIGVLLMLLIGLNIIHKKEAKQD